MKHPKLLTRKTILLPTAAGWTVIGVALFALVFGGTVSIVSFLSPNAPIASKAIIVEGWLPDYCFNEVAALLKDGTCSKVFVTGGPLETGSYLREYRTYAALGAATLRALAVPDSMMIPIPAAYAPTDRTYASAVAFGKWIDSTQCPLRSFNLLSQSTHTRRSALLFKRALGKSFSIGALAIADPDYQPGWWWRSSKGFRSVVDESIAFCYALFFVTMH
jgi:hypothetical protein